MKLQPGDYVSTEGMTEEQYHAVCKAFMDAGADEGDTYEYSVKDYEFVGWYIGPLHSLEGVYSFDANSSTFDAFKRKLTINQILGTKETSMDLRQAYKIMQDNCGIEAGDTVKVLRKAEDYENGWDNTWDYSMGFSVGKEFKVVKLHERGITLYDDYSAAYPFFVLELVKKALKLPEPIEISSTYSCEFKGDGSIAVGCQELDFDLIEKIYLTAKEVKEDGRYA